MQTRFCNLHPALNEFVQCIMIIHAEVEKDSPPVLCPYPPTPQNSLFFYLGDLIKVKLDEVDLYTSQPRSVIVGPQLKRVTIDINRNHKAVRVGFHPGGLHRLMGCPMWEMVDSSHDAEDVFGCEIRLLNDRLQEANSFDDIHRLVEEFLLLKVYALKKDLPFDLAMLELIKQNGNIPMERVASLACLSLRQFERVSRDRIGIPPKLFARLTRFSSAYRIRESDPSLSWTDIAYECGYFDQMHFIRDFKEFAGVTPRIIERELRNVPVKLQASLRL